MLGKLIALWGSRGRGALSEASDPEVERVTVWLTGVATILAHTVGAVVVVVLLVFVLPLPPQVRGDGDSVTRNLIAVAIYVPIALAAGLALGLRIRHSATAWMREDRAPSDAELEATLRLPARLLYMQLALWAVAIVPFTLINASTSGTLAFEVAITIALGGITTASLAYLIATTQTRELIARAFRDRSPPADVNLPGVGVRSMLGWALGTAVPVAGIALLAGASLGLDVDSSDLARSVLVLGLIALITGFRATYLVARSISDPLQELREALASVERGELSESVRVDDTTEVGFLQSGFNRMVSGLRERERVRDLFGRHVGEDVAQRALDEGMEMGGEERQVAALFVDVIGSTAIAIEREPTEVVDLLNAFFEIVVGVTDERGGFVNKFEGDGALCVFGAPLPLDDFAGAALAAGREMSERIAGELDDLEAVVGISAGEVVAGNIGAADRFEYTVIGDPVNEASRLAELAKQHQGHVLASAAALKRAGEEAGRWQEEGEETLRGRDRPTGLASPKAGA